MFKRCVSLVKTESEKEIDLKQESKMIVLRPINQANHKF